jgi:hypothetical protein
MKLSLEVVLHDILSDENEILIESSLKLLLMRVLFLLNRRHISNFDDMAKKVMKRERGEEFHINETGCTRLHKYKIP